MASRTTINNIPQRRQAEIIHLRFKLDAISHARINGNRAAAKKSNVDEKRFRECGKKYEEMALTEAKNGGVSRKRLTDGGRKLSNIREITEMDLWSLWKYG